MQDLVGAFFDAADTRRCFYFYVVADSRGLSRLDIEPCAGCSWARRLASHTTRWAARCWHVGVVGGRRGGLAVAVAVDRASAMADAARANHRPVCVPLWGAVWFDPRVFLDASLCLCSIAHCIHGFCALLTRWGNLQRILQRLWPSRNASRRSLQHLLGGAHHARVDMWLDCRRLVRCCVLLGRPRIRFQGFAGTGNLICV